MDLSITQCGVALEGFGIGATFSLLVFFIVTGHRPTKWIFLPLTIAVVGCALVIVGN